MARYLLARECAERISEELNVPLSDVVDVLVKIPAVDMTKVLSDLKRQIHDKAVYPNCHGVEPYISLKVFDAVINKLIGS
jgi:hypothetical protein